MVPLRWNLRTTAEIFAMYSFQSYTKFFGGEMHLTQNFIEFRKLKNGNFLLDFDHRASPLACQPRHRGMRFATSSMTEPLVEFYIILFLQQGLSVHWSVFQLYIKDLGWTVRPLDKFDSRIVRPIKKLNPNC